MVYLSFRKIGEIMSDDFGQARYSDKVLNNNVGALRNHVQYSKVDGYKGFNTKKGKSLLGF